MGRVEKMIGKNSWLVEQQIRQNYKTLNYIFILIGIIIRDNFLIGTWRKFKISLQFTASATTFEKIVKQVWTLNFLEPKMYFESNFIETSLQTATKTSFVENRKVHRTPFNLNSTKLCFSHVAFEASPHKRAATRNNFTKITHSVKRVHFTPTYNSTWFSD